MGGRGASASGTKNLNTKIVKYKQKAQESTNTVDKAYYLKKAREAELVKSGQKLNNKNNLIDFVKQQTKIDLNKAIDEDRFSTKSRTYLDIDSRKLSINEFNTIRRLLQYDKGLRFESNGAYNYAIYYKKNRR